MKLRNILFSLAIMFIGITSVNASDNILSYFDVILHNLDEDPIYKFWNFFQLLVKSPL